ncbi:glycoside hydrolase family 55 protein [Clostridioides difficile]|nr:glycoside hydrolase family 55 protein [Clostridioides difficile]
MGEPIIIKETDGRINVLDYGVFNDETKDVSSRVQEIINAAPEDSIIYFPEGKYLFTSGIEINKRLTLCGDAYFRSNTPNNEFFYSGTTQFSGKFDKKEVEDGTMESFTMITVKGVKHCIKSISFQSNNCDSVEISEKDDAPPPNGEPGFHHKLEFTHEGKYISAIVCDDVSEGSGHYENVDFGGFGGTALKISNNSTVNDITVFSCNHGISTGENSIITNGKAWGCDYGMEISTGTFINGMRVEEVGRVAIDNIGKGLNFVTNVTIDQCGYCGFKFDSISNTQISGNISRCGQFYFNFNYDDYLKLDNRVKEAYSLFYGNSMESTNITITNDNGDYWNDKGSQIIDKDGNTKFKKHKIYIINALETKNVLLRCPVDATDMVVESEKGNLIYNNKEQTVIFYNGKIGSINGIGMFEEDHNDKIKIKNYDIYINDNIKMYRPQVNDIISTSVSDINSVSGQYKVKLERISQNKIFETPIYYYKVIEKMV